MKLGLNCKRKDNTTMEKCLVFKSKGELNCKYCETVTKSDFLRLTRRITQYFMRRPDVRTQCGQVVILSALALKSGDPGFKTPFDHSFNLTLG